MGIFSTTDISPYCENMNKKEPQSFHITSGGIVFHFRPIGPSDKELLQDGFSQLTEKSKYLRFFALRKKLSEYQLNYFTEVDGTNSVAWGIADETNEVPKPAGVGRFIRLSDDPDVAEVAITVVDAYQKKGLGRMLFAILNILAAQVGVKTFRYYVLTENTFVLAILKNFDILKQVNEGQVVIVDTQVFSSHEKIPVRPDTQRFIEAMKQVEDEMIEKM
jgi:GNAT superfamily N-acetyltransferase